MLRPEQRFYDTYVRPIRNGPALKLLIYLALSGGSTAEPLAASYRKLAGRVGLDRSTLVHAVRRLEALPGPRASPVLQRLRKGRGRLPSLYTAHVPELRCA